MTEEKIFLVSYDPNWVSKFEEEKVLIQKTIGNFITGGIHHIGSTSIPGLSAKPIIDILVGVDSLEKTKPCIELLKEIEYCYYPYKTESRHWFCKPSLEKRTHHVHLIETSHPEFKAVLAFRDYLITYPEKAKEYEDLKVELARKFANDREAYTEGKTNFVKAVTEQALGEVKL